MKSKEDNLGSYRSCLTTDIMVQHILVLHAGCLVKALVLDFIRMLNEPCLDHKLTKLQWEVTKVNYMHFQLIKKSNICWHFNSDSDCDKLFISTHWSKYDWNPKLLPAKFLPMWILSIPKIIWQSIFKCYSKIVFPIDLSLSQDTSYFIDSVWLCH